jgi:hypothetical protein
VDCRFFFSSRRGLSRSGRIQRTRGMHKLACDCLHPSCLVQTAIMKIILEQSMEGIIRFEFFTRVKIKTGVFCNMIPCIPVMKASSALHIHVLL